MTFFFFCANFLAAASDPATRFSQITRSPDHHGALGKPGFGLLGWQPITRFFQYASNPATRFSPITRSPDHQITRFFHYSSSSDDPAPYLRVIRETNVGPNTPLPAGESIRAGIVTHHFLASGLMVRFFAELRAQSSPETIVLIGPNHFHHGLANISLSSLPWKTPFGLLQTDAALVRRLRREVNLPEDPEAFTGEHSVGVLVPFLKYYFPHSRVVPILVDVNAQSLRLKKLRKALAELLNNPKVLVLLSMDFSHDSTAAIADSRDEQAQRTIAAMNARGVNNLHVDCRHGLWLLLASLGDVGPVNVEIKEHTNSARLTNNPAQPDVTSYFAVFFVGK